MNTIFTPTVKRYLLSSSVTFLSTFFLLMGTELQSVGNPSALTSAMVIGLVVVAGRAAFKAVIEAVVGGHADLPSITTTTPPAQQ